jgi:hypothetical protein
VPGELCCRHPRFEALLERLMVRVMPSEALSIDTGCFLITIE